MKKYTTPIVCMALLVSAMLSSCVSTNHHPRTINIVPPPSPDSTPAQRPTVLVIPSIFVPQPPGPPRTSFVMQWTVDPSNGAPGYLDLYTVVEVSTNNGKTWTFLDKVWGTTNNLTVPLDPTTVSRWFRTRWSPTNIVIHPL